MGTRHCILAIDIGTSATKAIVFDAYGKHILFLRKSYSIMTPQAGWNEQNPDVVFRAVLEAIRETYERKPDDVAIAGIVFSSQMYSILAVNHRGEPLTNSLTWADRRSATIAKSLTQHPEIQEVYTRTGCPIDAIYPLSKIQWLKEQHDAEEITRFISIKEYIMYKLIGKFVVDWSIASATGFFDIRHYKWDQQALSLINISSEQLSELVPPKQVFTEWNSDVLSYTAIPSGTPCIIGGGDGPLASIGVGASNPGVLAVNVGTSAAARYLISEPLVDPNGRLWTYVVDKDVWVIGGITSSGGILYEWFTKTMSFDGNQDKFLSFLKPQLDERSYKKAKELLSGGFDHKAMNALVANITPGADNLNFIPYLGGEQCPVWDPATRGSFIGITFKHTKAHFVRAVFEGIARSIYRMAESIETTIHYPIQEIRVTGGLSTSSAWLQIAADMFGYRVIVPKTAEGSAKGAALLAMTALGMEPKGDHFSDHHHKSAKIEPDEDVHRFYTTQYAHFKTLLNTIKAVNS